MDVYCILYNSYLIKQRIWALSSLHGVSFKNTHTVQSLKTNRGMQYSQRYLATSDNNVENIAFFVFLVICLILIISPLFLKQEMLLVEKQQMKVTSFKKLKR